MEFDVKRVYTSVNADEVKVGSKVILADDVCCLKKKVEAAEDEFHCYVYELNAVHGENSDARFYTKDFGDFILCYLVSEPEEKKLKWTDLKIGDVIRNKNVNREYMVIAKNNNATARCHICVYYEWILDKELESWEKVKNESC